MGRTEEELQDLLYEMDRRGYPAYKSLRGSYDFSGGMLSIDHVQGDPFASPTKASAYLPARVGGWPGDLLFTPERVVAFEDFLTRRLSRALDDRSRVVGGSGKSGMLGTSRPGPEVLTRSACTATREGVTVRFELGLPARGRTVDGRGAARMLLELVPDALDEALVADEEAVAQAREAADLADDQAFVRAELERLGLVAFVADDSVLPRRSGVSSAPMEGALPFRSPDSLAVTLDLPHRGPTRGMAIHRGVTLVVGGGYHGKSTLLRALQEGVYNHVAGDGRELVVTDASAVKLRSEDGRSVRATDISLFIGDLPSGADTRAFSTDDASGSTSQAAGTVEAALSGSRVLLIDEDTSATNFMVRDELMEAVVNPDHEPITPFVERVRDLWERAGISSVIVAGSSGAFFTVADTVVQMDCYEAHDVTERARTACEHMGVGRASSAPGFALPATEAPCRIRTARDERGPRARSFGREGVQVGEGSADLRLVEQLVEAEQVAAIAQLVRKAAQLGLLDGTLGAAEVAERLLAGVADGGWESVAEHGVAACGLALPRAHELAAALRRWRNERPRPS